MGEWGGIIGFDLVTGEAKPASSSRSSPKHHSDCFATAIRYLYVSMPVTAWPSLIERRTWDL